MSLNNYKKIDNFDYDEYGKIELVKNEKDDSLYLMKIISKRLLKNKNESYVFEQMEKLSSLENQNLSKYKDFFFTENSFNIIIEYEEDCSLKQKIKYNIDNHLSFEENYIWSLTIQLLNLVKFIQDNKNIDFNLSISNLLLMNNGLLKLYNYGNELISHQDFSASIQDFNYNIPPEYFNDNCGNNINADSANIWIAGCIIYELCSSKHPFSGENKREYISKVIKGEYQPIEIKYSDDFNKLLSKMILTDPNKRASIDELLNSEIIKSRNIEVDDMKASENININFTFKKNNLKETKRQKQSINEMLQNDKYEIMKFTLSRKDSLPKYGEEDFDLVETGKFNINQNYNIIINENNRNNDFKNKIIEEQNKKDRIIENNNFNYNNPYRNNNKNPINNQVRNSKDNNLLRGNKNNKNNNNNNLKNKVLANDRYMMNNFRKDRQKTPKDANKRNNFWNEIDNNKRINNNFVFNENKSKSKSKNKDTNKKLVYPHPNKSNQIKNNINVIINSNEGTIGTKSKNNNKNDIKERTEQVLNMNKKFKIKTEKNKLNNDNKKKYPIMPNMQNPHEINVDKIINQIMSKKNVKNVKKKKINHNINNKMDFLNYNFDYGSYGGENYDKKILNNNYILKKEPVIKAANFLPNITYGKNNKIKIEYGVLKYNSDNNKKKIKLKGKFK